MVEASGDARRAAGEVAGDRPWRVASRQFRTFLRRVPAGGRVLVLADSHPDGLAAATILRRALRRAGHAVEIAFPLKGEAHWSNDLRRRALESEPAALIVAGLSAVPRPPLPPTLVLGRATPAEPTPEVERIEVSGLEPEPSVSVIAYWLGQGLADVRRFDWVAAVGAMAAFGERVPLPLVIEAKRAYGGDWLRQVMILLRAARRSARQETEAALRLLNQARDPRDFVLTERPEQEQLVFARDQVEAAIEAARENRPLAREPFLLGRVQSPHEIHGLLARIWLSRSEGRPTLIGNTGYLRKSVAFGATAPTGSDWPARFLAALPPTAARELAPDGDTETLRGYVREADWPALLSRLGAPPGVWEPGERPGSGRPFRPGRPRPPVI